MPPIALDTELPLARASRYSFPEDGNAILPVIIGDYISSTHVPTDDEDGGLLPSQCIDKQNLVWELNDVPNPDSAGVRIYWNDTRQYDVPGVVYTYYPAIDYESRGHIIAAVKFHVNPGSRRVSWRGQGARQLSTGALLTNPIDALAYVFGRYGGWQASDTDYAAIAETQRLMATLGDTMNWVFSEQRTYRDWLHESLKPFHCDFSMTDAGRLAITLDTSVTTQAVSALTTIDARTDLLGPYPQPVIPKVDADDIVTRVTANSRWKWTENVKTATVTENFYPGQSYHGIRARTFDLPGVYSLAQFQRWLYGIWLRYGIRPMTMRMTVRGLQLAAAMPGTLLGLIWPEMGWPTAQLVKVLSNDADDDLMATHLTVFDCQRQVTDAATLPVVAMPTVRSRPRQSSPTVDITPPGPASNLVATGSYRTIVLTATAPQDSDYDYTEIWASQTNNRATATPMRNGGVGAAPGTTWQETFEVADAAIWYVWLMTVDRNKNGANGGIGPSGGNWFPLSPTAGVLAAAALVPTGGILPAAVTGVYGPDASFLGAAAGESYAAGTFLPATNPTGSMVAWGNVSVTIPSLCTAIALIRENSIVGPILGTTIISNITNVTLSPLIVVPGAHFSPTFGVTYWVTVQVFNQAPSQVAFTKLDASLQLMHSKR